MLLGGTLHPDELGQLRSRRQTNNLNAYRKLRCIGQGAFGKAYLVEKVGAAGDVSHFVLKKIGLKDAKPGQQDMAYREAMLLRQISKGFPYIVRFQEVFLAQKGSHLCLVMEFASGGDLRHALEAREGIRPSEEEALEWVAMMCLALRHCHALGALHRDVKPENCFFASHGGRLLLGDFGIAVSLDERTHAETCIGTPYYLSPEVMSGENYGPTSDMWALGVMAYESVALQRPFPGQNLCHLAMQIVEGTPQPLPGAPASPELQSVLQALLDKDARRRPTASAALELPGLARAAERACLRHQVPWPLDESAGKTRRGLVERLREQATAVHAAPAEDYPDDFEAASDEGAQEEECYEPDFEDFNDDEMPGGTAAKQAGQHVSSRDDLGRQVEELRRRLAVGQGSPALEAELGGVLDFIDGLMTRSSAH